MNICIVSNVNRLWIVALPTVAIGLAAFCECQETHTSATADNASHGDVGTQIVQYTKQGQYEEAVQTGLRSLKNRPSDEAIYQQIADVYLIRADKDPEGREQWISKAVSYTDKALSLNSKDRDAAGVHVFQIARSYESAGDLSAGNRCSYYEHAKRLLEGRAPLLKSESIVLQGKTFPLAPLRNENERVLAEVTAKSQKANCN